MAEFLPAAVDITPGLLTGWQVVDVSALVPVGTTGIIGRVTNASALARAGGWRNNGSADNRVTNINASSYVPFYIGVDGARLLNLYRNNVNVSYLITGYFGADAVFFTNAVDVTPGVLGSYQSIDISALTGADTALAAVFEINTGGAVFGLRMNGSADNRTSIAQHTGAIIGVDGAEICQANSPVAARVWLVGYITSGVVMALNALDVSIAALSVWTDLTALPLGAFGGIYEISSSATSNPSGLRENGAADAPSGRSDYCIAAIKCDANRLVEGWITNVAVDFWQVGYFMGNIFIDSPTPDQFDQPWSPVYQQDAPEGVNAYASLYGLHSKEIELGQRRQWQKFERR